MHPDKQVLFVRNEQGMTPNTEPDGLFVELERELDRIQDSKVS